MTLRTVLIGAVTAAAFVLLFGPWTYVLVTGRPMSLDCGAFEPAACDEAWRKTAAAGWGFNEFGFGPVTWAKFEGEFASLSCGENTLGHWWPSFDPLAITSYGLC